jgi:general secretion pathway protein D
MRPPVIGGRRRVKTSVAVNNGEALVLGGLIQDSKTLARNQIPILVPGCFWR